MKYYGIIMPSVFPTGVFVQSVQQTASSDESEGVNTWTMTLTNQQQASFNVQNGKTGTGAVVETTGMFGFYIDGSTGNLMLSYSGNNAPNLSLNNNGELIYTY
jgi:hypothetical protein